MLAGYCFQLFSLKIIQDHASSDFHLGFQYIFMRKNAKMFAEFYRDAYAPTALPRVWVWSMPLSCVIHYTTLLTHGMTSCRLNLPL